MGERRGNAFESSISLIVCLSIPSSLLCLEVLSVQVLKFSSFSALDYVYTANKLFRWSMFLG